MERWYVFLLVVPPTVVQLAPIACNVWGQRRLFRLFCVPTQFDSRLAQPLQECVPHATNIRTLLCPFSGYWTQCTPRFGRYRKYCLGLPVATHTVAHTMAQSDRGPNCAASRFWTPEHHHGHVETMMTMVAEPTVARPLQMHSDSCLGRGPGAQAGSPTADPQNSATARSCVRLMPVEKFGRYCGQRSLVARSVQYAGHA